MRRKVLKCWWKDVRSVTEQNLRHIMQKKDFKDIKYFHISNFEKNKIDSILSTNNRMKIFISILIILESIDDRILPRGDLMDGRCAVCTLISTGSLVVLTLAKSFKHMLTKVSLNVNKSTNATKS